MILTADDQAIISLVARTADAERDPVRPLNLRDYNRLVAILSQELKEPAASVYRQEIRTEVEKIEPSLSAERLYGLVEGRATGLAILIERLESIGITILTRASAEYPSKIRQRLKAAAPPVLYACGNLDLTATPSMGIVGSRSADEDSSAFASRAVRFATGRGKTIVSGGAKGIDSIGHSEALSAGGGTIAIVPGEVLRLLSRREWREAVEEHRGLILTAVHPETRFTVGNAMARNRLIYAAADATLVVAADLNKGGTWNGAVEALKHGWGRVFVRAGKNAGPGNEHLIQKGGTPVADPDSPFWEQSSPTETAKPPQGGSPESAQLRLFG